LIAALILWSSWVILDEAVNVLLEAVPIGLDMRALEEAIRNVPGILNAHDLHVWTVSSGIIACSCHILVAEQSVRSGQQVMQAVTDMMKQQFGITHATIQVEVEGCGPNEIYCTLRPSTDAHEGHHPGSDRHSAH
jgi:cobalt-zinc-cadmium efflux system protein